MNELLDQFRSLLISKTAKDTYIVFVGNIISFSFGIIFTVLAARAIEPAGWGIFSAAGGLMVILFAFSEMGLSAGLFKFVASLWTKGEKDEAEKIVSAIFLVRIVTALIFSLLMVFLAGPLSLFLFKTSQPELIYLTAAGLIGSLLLDFQVSLLQAKRKWVFSTFLIAATNFFRLAGLGLLNYWTKLDLVGLFIVFFLAPHLTFLFSVLGERPSFSFSPDFLTIFKKISRFSLWMGINRLVGSISSRVDSILLLQLSGAYNAGIVGAARQLSNAAMILLGSFATVIAPQLATYEGIHLKKHYRKIRLLSLFLGIGVLGAVIVVDPIISLLGSKYTPSASVLKCLLVGLVPFALATPSVNALIYAFQKPQIIALLSVIQLPLIIAGNLFLIPKIGIFGPVVVIGFWNLSTLLVTHFFSRRYFAKLK